MGQAVRKVGVKRSTGGRGHTVSIIVVVGGTLGITITSQTRCRTEIDISYSRSRNVLSVIKISHMLYWRAFQLKMDVFTDQWNGRRYFLTYRSVYSRLSILITNTIKQIMSAPLSSY